MKKNYLFIVLMTGVNLSNAQQVPLTPTAISLGVVDVAYTQNFDSPNLSETGNNNTALPVGWAFLETGGSNANGEYYARQGVQRNDTYSIGVNTGDMSDRALGSVVGPNMQNSKIGAKFVNNTGETITKLLINYAGEQWRKGNSGIPEKLIFSYSLDATDLATGTWTNVSNLDFTSLHYNTNAASTFVGNLPENRQIIEYLIADLEIEANETFWIRWENTGLSNAAATGDGNADAVGVDDFSLIPNPQTTPVSLGPFNHKKVGSTVQFNWETLSEQNNDYFEIQRSANGTDFATIASIPGNGNSTTKHNYNYTDFSPIEGISYYQLKQVDRNGNFKIYPPVSVTFGVGNLDFNIYSSEDKRLNLNIYTPSKTLSVLQIVDVNGREVLKQEVALEKGYNDVNLNIAVVGVYVAILSSDASVVKKKFINK